MSMETLSIQVRFLSDWHIGTGTGRPGDIDRLTARDHDGLPFVPAKTLTGILRDAGERLALALDDGQPGGPWTDLLTDLFGDQPALARGPVPASPRKARLSVRPARFAEPLAAHLRRDPTLRAALTFIKPGVMIDPRSGRAADQHLRFEEMVRLGAELATDMQLDLAGVAGDRADDLRALLLASLRLVERLGGKRRRGAGRVELTPATMSGGKAAVDAAIARLTQRPLPAPRLEESSPPATLPGLPMAQAETFTRLPVTITLDTPLAVGRRTLGNQVETLDFLPGSSLLPVIARACALAGIDVSSAIRRGDIRVSPLSPSVGDQPGLPVPFALARPKNVGADGYSFVNRLVQRDHDQQLKPLRDGYVAETASALTLVQVAPIQRTHNTIEDQVQRPTRIVGGLFTYAAIPAGTILSGEVTIRSDLAHRAVPAITALNGQPERLGRSKKDDYGAVTLQIGKPDTRSATVQARPDGLVTLWCLSDLLLRSPGLRATPTLKTLCEVVAGAFGGDTRVELDDNTLQMVRVRRLDSWQERWGMPRPSLLGLQAGSCIRLRITPPPTADQLAAIARDGVGERRAEGYGRISINPPLLDRATIPAKEMDGIVSIDDTSPLPVVVGAFAQALERQAWRIALHQAASLAGADADFRRSRLLLDDKASGPNMSQLGGLRAVLGRLRAPADRAFVLGWFDQVAKVRQRRKRWPAATLRAFRSLIEQPDHVWTLLHEAGRLSALPSLTGRPAAELREEMWADAVRTLFDAVFHNHKRLQDGQSSKDDRHGA